MRMLLMLIVLGFAPVAYGASHGNDDRARSSSGSSSNSSSPTPSSPERDAAAPQQLAAEELNLQNTTMPEDRVDTVLRTASRDDQRNVYLWTFPHTDGPGRATPGQYTRAQFAKLVVDAYELTGKTVGKWSVFLEVHPLSRSQQESVFFCLGEAQVRAHQNP